MTKSDFLRTLRQLVADSKTEEALDLLREHATEFDTAFITDATLLQSRFQALKSDFMVKGIVEKPDYDVSLQQIKAGLLDFADRIERAAPLSINRSSGRLLHKIPATMPVGRETRCIIRIAYDDATLLRDMKKDDNTTIEDVRIAEVMTVELVDFNETPAFQIRAATDVEQFIVSDDYTQWLFMVKPLREGKFPLMLKVAVLETVNGRERKRDIVLEKEISIISEAAAAQAATDAAQPQAAAASVFEDSNVRLNYVVTEDEPHAAASASTESVPARRFSMTGLVSAFAAVVMALAGFYVYNSTTPDLSKTNSTTSTEGENKGSKGHGDMPPPSPPPVVLDSVSVDSQRLKANSEKQLMAQTDDKKASKGDISTLPLPNSNASGSGTDDEAAKRKTDIADAEKRVAAKRKADIAAAERRAEAKRKATRERSEKSSKDASKNSPEVYVTKTEKIMTPEDGKPIESKTYKVRLNLKGKMKKAEILVDGQEVKVLERNIWGTPQYIEFKSSKTTHRITFVKDGVSCTVENIVIDSGDVDINPCSF